MQYSYAFLALLSATSVAALPLNINLGAYSPALVVGDGEISFGGEESAQNLVNALQTASQGTEAAANGLTRAAAEEATPAETPAPAKKQGEDPTPVVITPSGTTTPIPTGQGIGRDIEPRIPEPEPENTAAEVEKRDLAGFNAALNFATGALKTSPGVQLGTGAEGSGVGIIVEPGVDSGKAAAAAPAAKAAKRDEGSLPTVTLMKIRSLGGSDGE
jgi:hypothetical protein